MAADLGRQRGDPASERPALTARLVSPFLPSPPGQRRRARVVFYGLLNPERVCAEPSERVQKSVDGRRRAAAVAARGAFRRSGGLA